MRHPSLLLAAPIAAAAVLSLSSAAPAAASCQNLKVTPGLRASLVAAHARPREGTIAPGSLYYGRCGKTYYAIGSFTKAGGDQPEKFRKLSGKAWADRGDGFEDGCSPGARAPIPKALVALWHICGSL